MREKYIELIVEYLKQRPDYKTNLNYIRANVLAVGATKEEFHEAIRQIMDIPSQKTNESFKKPLESLKNASGRIPEVVKFGVKSKKKYFTAAAVLIIILIFTTAVGQ